MRAKKPIRILIAAAVALAVLAGCAAALSFIVYGRSPQATAYEIILRFRHADDRTPEEETARLEAKRGTAEAPSALPAWLKARVETAETEYAGLQTFVLNPGGGSATVVYLHGGAYVNGFNAHQWRLLNKLSDKTECEILAPAYHLASYGDCVRGCEDVTALFCAVAEARPGRRIILMGDSAGGGLAMAVAENLVARGGLLPERLILYSPWMDVSMDNPDIEALIPVDPILHFDLTQLHGRYWAGDSDVHDWRASPLFGEMTGLPPVTIYCGTRELLYPDLLLTRDKLEAAGVDLDFRARRGMNHDYPLMPIPEAGAALAETAALITGGT